MKRNLKRLKYVLNDKNKKPFHVIFKEVFTLWFQKKEFPLHYFGRKFFRKDAPKNFYDYMTLKQYNKINALVAHRNQENKHIYSILQNKLKLFEFCKENKIPTPKVFGHNNKTTFYFNGDSRKVHSVNDLQAHFTEVMAYHNVEKLFLKPVEGSGGYGAFFLTQHKLEHNAADILEQLSNAFYIHQEAVIQNDTINKIHAGSINTLRIETYRDKRGNIHRLGSFMRIGHGDMQVDNASSGGYMIVIDAEKGTLIKSASRSLIYGSETITKHPDTGFVFEGFKIPFFEEAIELVIKLSVLLPCYFHGWDIALTNEGPTLIEGNYSPGLLFSERSYHGFKSMPIFDEILKEAEVYHKNQK